jgi:hypothetical protein
VLNWRDLGGLKASNGKQKIKLGMCFRSGQLCKLDVRLPLPLRPGQLCKLDLPRRVRVYFLSRARALSLFLSLSLSSPPLTHNLNNTPQVASGASSTLKTVVDLRSQSELKHLPDAYGALPSLVAIRP